jgi:hypothetical protein
MTNVKDVAKQPSTLKSSSQTSTPAKTLTFNDSPLANSSRKKDRRWPLVLRFWKGSIHSSMTAP